MKFCFVVLHDSDLGKVRELRLITLRSYACLSTKPTMAPQLSMDTILLGQYLLLLMSKTYEREYIILTNQTNQTMV